MHIFEFFITWSCVLVSLNSWYNSCFFLWSNMWKVQLIWSDCEIFPVCFFFFLSSGFFSNNLKNVRQIVTSPCKITKNIFLIPPLYDIQIYYLHQKKLSLINSSLHFKIQLFLIINSFMFHCIFLLSLFKLD